ncbi:MAG: hypothetical protein QN187_03550 [Armatimonadota bacterium]|nr:hypothetical protein [Armatimonadota bacterium]MDR7518964.1 hypothetical protein [Armatimonadota bacterium]MDR7548565.1 hypothetical protein [Armatimonadota bacterium]
MPGDYQEASRKEAEQIRRTLAQLDKLLESDTLHTVYATDASDLRTRVVDVLKRFQTNLTHLGEVDRADIFKTNPIHAETRYRLIENIVAAQIEFETEVVPALNRLTSQVVAHARAHPPASLDVSRLPPPPSGEPWTVQRVVDAAERLVEQGTKAVQVATKAYALVKALGLLIGIPVP